jgi:hypothetical protein
VATDETERRELAWRFREPRDGIANARQRKVAAKNSSKNGKAKSKSQCEEKSIPFDRPMEEGN